MHQPPWLPGPLGGKQVCRFFERLGLGTNGTDRLHLHVGSQDEQVVQPGQVCLLTHAEVFAYTPTQDYQAGTFSYAGSYWRIQRRNGEATCWFPVRFGLTDNDANMSANGLTSNFIGQLGCPPILEPLVFYEGDRADIVLNNATNPRTDFRGYVSGIVLPVVNNVPGWSKFVTERRP